MPRPLTLDQVKLSLGGTTLNGVPNSSYIFLYGSGEPGRRFSVFNEVTGRQEFPSLYPFIRENGTWFAEESYRPPVGRYDYHAVDLDTGERSPTARLLVGTSGADTLTGPTIGATVTGPTYLFSQGGSVGRAGPAAGGDTFIAYVLGSDAAGGGANDVRVTIDGNAGTDTVVVPVALDDLVSHGYSITRYGLNDSNGPLRLSVRTADAEVSLLSVDRLRFNDVTLTIQYDPLADFLFYAARYPDAAAADVNVRVHYDSFGWREGRDPNALFSTFGYLSASPDVRAAGLNPLTHYSISGWREGRDPSAEFDTSLYLLFNPDVARAGMDPLLHYLGVGVAEGRKASPVVETTLVRDGFDPHYYTLANPDVGLARLNPAAHYAAFGSAEGRNPNAFFDTNDYRARNPDVVAADYDMLAHYQAFGWREGRDPSSHFDTSSYLAANADVAAAGISPLQHFLQFGIAEGRSSFGDLF